ncbi:MAG TPA: hemerythrin domain-containing protein [Bryobacteraceae bacterium]|nr:hemerythrin domain-containing protein [Bryobacteraceae bacterium]
MRIIQALLGEHGAMYPLLELIERTAAGADLPELKIRASCLRSAVGTHAKIEDELLRPAIQAYLAPPATAGDGTAEPTDHEVIESGLSRVLASAEAEQARQSLLDTVAKTREHFLKEETIIFGIAARELPPEFQEQLGAEWARRRGVSLVEADGPHPPPCAST